MFNKKVLDLICKNYPISAKDIGESIGLLNLVLDDLLNEINGDITKALNERDYNAATNKIELHKIICNLYDENSNIIDTIDDYVVDEQKDEIIEQTDEVENHSIPDYGKYVVDQLIPHSLYENFEFKKPVAFIINGNKIEASNWANVFQLTCEYLYSKNQELFEGFISDKNMNGKKKSYFSLSNENIRKPRMLSCADIYIETNLSANSIKQIIIKMLKKYQIKITEYIVFYRADYTELAYENNRR